MSAREFVGILNGLFNDHILDESEYMDVALALGAFAARLIRAAYVTRNKQGKLVPSWAAVKFAES